MKDRMESCLMMKWKVYLQSLYQLSGQSSAIASGQESASSFAIASGQKSTSSASCDPSPIQNNQQ